MGQPALNCLGKDKMAVLIVCSSEKDEALEDIFKDGESRFGWWGVQKLGDKGEEGGEKDRGDTWMFVEEGRGGM